MFEFVRRFGLECCDLTTMLWNVAIMLRFLVLNIDSSYRKRPRLCWYIFTILCMSCYFYVYLLSTIYYVGWKYPENHDTLSTLILVSLGVSSEIGTTKYIYMFFARKTLVGIIDDYRICDATVPKNSRMQRSILKTLRNVKKRAMIFWFVIVANGVIYLIMPFFKPGRHLTEDRQILYGLEPMFETPNYEIAMSTLFLAVIPVCYLPANVTALFIVLVGYTEAQMTALTEEMLALWGDAQEHIQETPSNGKSIIATVEEYKSTNAFIKNRLKDIIQRHGTVINLLRRLESLFRLSIAVEFILLILGLIFELLGGLENTYIEIPYAFMQVFMDCLTGQRLMNASAAFEVAVYSCKWENFDPSNRRTVVMMLLCSQKYLTLSAGGISTLSFTCLMGVIRSVYSAYATLRQAVHRL